MSTPSIIVGRGNWGVKTGNLLGYSLVDSLYLPREFTCSRADNTATRVNRNGNIEGVNANVPRIDYLGGQARLLVEPSAQNFHPEGDSMASFSTFSGGGAPAPLVTSTTSLSGLNNAALVVGGNGSTGNWGIFRLIPAGISSGQTVTYSVFAKAGTNNFMQLLQSNVSGTGGNSAYFDLSNGTTPTANARIENWGNGWYRCIMPPFTFTATPDGTYNIGHRLTENTTTNAWSTPYSGKSVVFYGAQLEIGSVATSYIPTLSTVPVTRNADTISLTGATNLIGQTEGTIYLELEQDPVNRDIFSLNTGTGNSIIFYKNGSNIVTVRLYANSLEVFTLSNAVATNGFVKIAFAYKAGDSAMVVNAGTAQTSSSSFTFSSSLSLASLTPSWFTNAGFTKIRAAEIYPTRLPNVAQPGVLSLQSLTAI